MAAKQVVILFQWENGKSFQMLVQEPGMENYLTIVRIEENSDIGSIWNNTEEICKTYVKQQIYKIGEEMKA